MTGTRPAATLSGGVALLERAVSYTLGQLHGVTAADLSRPTPCPRWDLRGLLEHMDDSLTALQEALDVRQVGPEPGPGYGYGPAPGYGYGPGPWYRPGPGYGPAGSPVALVGALRDRGCQLLGALAVAADDLVWVGGFPIPASVVTSAGAVDIAVHGWDVARACGRGQPIPGPLAEDMLEISALLVSCADRPARFAAQVAVPPQATASDRLVAFLGRDPA
jgi:uncharacterized protein (TIGR03083 family)